MRIYLITCFIWNCIKIGAKPWKFAQINSPIYDDERHIFSKLDIEKLIPKKWRLKSYVLALENKKNWKHDILKKFDFPVFLKPEWGQNSYGVFRADDPKSLHQLLEKIKTLTIPYFAQESVSGMEVDVFYMNHQILSITQMHDFHGEKFPINGIHNGTQNIDISHDFSIEDFAKIESNLQEIYDAPLARFGCKAKSREDFVTGNFKIIEINMFLPFPLNLLDKNIPVGERCKFLRKFAAQLAQIVKGIQSRKSKNIFWPMVRRHFQIKG